MADEPDALAGAEPETPPVEGADQQDEQQSLTVEALASELGWKPKEEWKGEGWQTARDFLSAPREGRDSTKRELRGLRDQLERVTRTSSQLLEDKLAERDAYWARVQAKAVEDGDNAGVDKAVAERLKLKDTITSAIPAGPPPEVMEFQERHKWFGKDISATARAHELAERFAKLGADVPTQLVEVERTMKRERPDLFPKAKEAPGTQTGTSRAANSGSRAKGFADMPAESQAMAVDYEKRHGIKKDDFAKSYWADVEKKQRRAA